MAKIKSRLEGLEELGSKLRELRVRAGISQMKLAEILGLNPTHGYKYILRLEKGLVPNPTIRTITGYLTACNAGWQEIADVISRIRLAAPNSEGKRTDQLPADKPKAAESAVITPSALPVLPPASERFREKFWQLVNQAVDRARTQLIISNPSPGTWRNIFIYIRSVCRLIADSPRESLHARIEHLTELTARQGVEPEILSRLSNICLEVFEPGK